MTQTTPQNDYLLEVSGLKIHFFTGAGIVQAVDGVDFDLAAGETLGLVGESGSGKTISSLALLKLVPRPGKILAGSIRFDNEDLIQKSESDMIKIRGKRIAMIFQNPAFSLNPIYSIGNQLGEILMWHEKMNRRDAFDRVAELLNLVGITDPGGRLRQFPHELSGGMKQRVCIARALLCKPLLVLADEPTTNLDVTIQAQILQLLSELRDRFNMSMILVTHDLGVVANMADRITVMYGGRICETATTEQIFNNPQHPYTKALLETIPRVDQSYSEVDNKRLTVVPGRIPNLITPPTGCRFHPRCVEADGDCALIKPELKETKEPGHVVSCLKR
ncbi:Oligopeptide transport system permease protein OppB (TC 3.A.1.5.1) [Olavius algarvensis associated proteobacterium Delta 3]|nr:Oligopeptide transport system permease protein OppB (TC 3.A.1.5.1) [Olavius algarvensis associated proteobacterium Delta 3]